MAPNYNKSERDGDFAEAIVVYMRKPAGGLVRPRLDGKTEIIPVLNFEENKIHNGDHYFYNDKVSLGDGGTQTYLLTTPDSTNWIHLEIEWSSTLDSQITLAESADRNGTTPQDTYCSDRNNANVPDLEIHKSTSGGTTDGTTIYTWCEGTDTTTGNPNCFGKIILKQNTKYLITLTSATASNDISLLLKWIEHTNL